MSRLGRVSRIPALVVALAIMLTACGGGDGGDPTATVAPPPTAAPSATSAVVGGSLVSDGICQVTIPDDWSDEGTARGRTATNARWTLFGNMLGSDTEWQTAVNLLKNQQAKLPGAVVEEGPERVVITRPGNRTLVVRQRFQDRYCELSVAAVADVPAEVAASWVSVANGLARAEEPATT